MAAFIFDSHTLAKRLRSSGFTEDQAEVIIDASRDALSYLVTKDDLDARLTILEQRMTIRLGAMLAASVALTAALVKLL